MPTAVVLQFHRTPKWFLRLFVDGPMLEVHRNAMLQIGRPTIMGEGVKVLCEPQEVNDILFAILTDGVTFADSAHLELDDLRASHVVLSASLEPVVMAAIAAEPGTGLTGGRSRDKVTVSRRADFEVEAGIAAPWQCCVKTPRIVPAHMIISTSSCGPLLPPSAFAVLACLIVEACLVCGGGSSGGDGWWSSSSWSSLSS